MQNLIDIGSLSHRSRERVKNLGEVFTPEAYVENMLSLLDKNIWSDESVIFFEPSCGHGNIVLSIYKRRLEGLYNKAIKQDEKNPELYAVANSINTLWAIDVDPRNVESCKTRVLLYTFEFLRMKSKLKSDISIVQKNKDFFSHVLCALNWQIHENEALSGLSDTKNAKLRAELTLTGKKWFAENNHIEIDFETPWSLYYCEGLKDKKIPIEYIRSQKFVNNILTESVGGYKEFNFAMFLISKNKLMLEV